MTTLQKARDNQYLASVRNILQLGPVFKFNKAAFEDKPKTYSAVQLTALSNLCLKCKEEREYQNSVPDSLVNRTVLNTHWLYEVVEHYFKITV